MTLFTEYCIRAANILTNGFTITHESLHDAEVSVSAIKEVNLHLTDNLKFHGWVTIWTGYSLDDGSKVTVSEELVDGLNF